MKPSADPKWNPDPQLLSAYFDGELEADVRARIEVWLEAHPETAEEWAVHKKVRTLWRDTTPAEPRAAVWDQVLERIDVQRKQPIAAPAGQRPWLTAGIIAASIVIFIGLLLGGLRSMLPKPGPEQPLVKLPQPTEDFADIDMLQVAAASEVTILRIDGADTEAVVVGEMPVSGPLDLAASGEVCITCKCPRVNVRQNPPYRPMVWARLDPE